MNNREKTDEELNSIC